MRPVQTGPLIGLSTQLVLLGALAATVGLSSFGWGVGITCGVVTNAALARALVRYGDDGLRRADLVTLTRATLVGGVAALAGDAFVRSTPVTTLVALATVALILDGVDGWIARRTGTASAFGARFDMEVDAFLILVLSVYVASSTGAWVLAIGAARYGFGGAGWLVPWLRSPVPRRHWRKVVAAIQGVVLTVAAADVMPSFLVDVALAAALALLLESFGRDVWWLWRQRRVESDRFVISTSQRETTPAAHVVTVLACLLVYVALVAPNETSRLTLGAFVRIPVEGLTIAALVLVLPRWATRMVALLVGAVLGLLAIVKVLDMGFFAVLDRPFNPVTDWAYFGPAAGVLSDSIGQPGATVSVVAAAALGAAVVVFMPLAALRLTRLVERNRARSIRAVTALALVWILCAAFKAQVASDAPIASTSATRLVYGEVSQVRAGLADRQEFAELIPRDAFRDVRRDDLLAGLRGKDVIVVFVESYGRVAVEGSAFASQVDAVLDSGTARLRAAGFSTRSAFLTSPTFGAASWLAHSTLQSGLWVDTQQRYNQLLATDRLTLSGAFDRAGWRTVFDDPAITRDWPDGSAFYGFDKLYDARNVGYAGPEFSYATMPDQFTLSTFQRLELAETDRPPVMAEIDLVSSHHPWTPLPHLVGWSRVGDGSVFDGMPEDGESPDEVFSDPDQVKTVYGQSIEYSLRSLISFVQTYPDPDRVFIVLGDHQPHTYVSGEGASHDVPITVIAHDPAVMDRISGWGWQDGMRPGPDAPVWPMDAFRDRFLTAYGAPLTSASSPVAPQAQR